MNSILYSKLDCNHKQKEVIPLSDLVKIYNPDESKFDMYYKKLKIDSKDCNSTLHNDDSDPHFVEWFKSLDENERAAERLKNYYEWYKKYRDSYKLDFVIWIRKECITCYLVICCFSDSINEIQMLEVMPSYKHSGLGTQLLQYAIEVYDANRLDVHFDNDIAIKMYTKAGFEICKRVGDKVVMYRKVSII